MIYSRSDYKFVNGDIDDIIINGGIMPLRADQYALRGEDIVFLMEAINDRREAVGASTFVRGFSKYVSSNNFSYPIISPLSALFSGRNYAKGYSNFPDVVRNIGQYENYRDAIPQWFYSNSDMTALYTDFVSGNQVLKEPVSRIFDDVAKLNFPVRESNNGSVPTGRYNSDYTITGTNGGGSFTIRRRFFGKCFYSYYNGIGVTNVSDYTFKLNNTSFTATYDGLLPTGMQKFKVFGSFGVLDWRKENTTETAYSWSGLVNLGELSSSVNMTTDDVYSIIGQSIVNMAHEDNGGGETKDSPFYFVPSSIIDWGFGSGKVNSWQQEISILPGVIVLVGELSPRTRW